MPDQRIYPKRPYLAVSAAIFRDGKVLIVRRARKPALGVYTLPGGGVETGETLLAALERELREEGNIELAEPPAFHAVYFNRRVSRRDHVALFVVRAFRQSAPPEPNREIIAHGFFAPDALPPTTTRAARERIAEVLGSRAAAEFW